MTHPTRCIAAHVASSVIASHVVRSDAQEDPVQKHADAERQSSLAVRELHCAHGVVAPAPEAMHSPDAIRSAQTAAEVSLESHAATDFGRHTAPTKSNAQCDDAAQFSTARALQL